MFDFFENRILVIIFWAAMLAGIAGVGIMILYNPIPLSLGYLIIGTVIISLRYDKDKTWKENFKILKEINFFDPFRIALFVWFSSIAIFLILDLFPVDLNYPNFYPFNFLSF